ncbi:STAS domain-containing protein [Streptomyces sp. NPDC058685]|uniref:STAS domain-containing protein n=1 Tax=Streptomyces sp. NPDC058685 TaxID=3346598 RepID=UPI00364B2387
MTTEDFTGQAADGPLGAQYATGGAWVVCARGEVDLNNLPPLTDALTRAAEAHAVIVLDASDITFADSTFLNVLLGVRRSADLRIAAPGPQIRRLLELTGADQVLSVYTDVEAAQPA